MKTKALVFTMVLAGAATWAFFQAGPGAAGALAGFCPPGALLYIEAQDFSAIVRDWNGSDVKRLWLQSANYEVFSRSRLFGRLEDAQGEFAAAAGVPANMSLVESVAGGASALALYDVGKLEFLYLTRIASARALESALWKAKSKFEPRNAGGTQYFVRVDGSTRRSAAFAVVNDLLLLATREDLVSGALTLLAGQAAGSTKSEGWYDKAVHASVGAGELRLVLNIPALTKSPHFRSYWIQRNVTELRQYSSAIIDERRSASEIGEERVLLRNAGAEAPLVNEMPVAQILRMVPDDAGFYRAWAVPSRTMIAALIEQKILNPRERGTIRSATAPPVPGDTGVAGTESALETRIDEPPLVFPRFSAEPLQRFLDTVNIDAALQLQWSRVLPDGVFVDNRSVIILQSSAGWNVNAVNAALSACNQGRWGSEFAVAVRDSLLLLGTTGPALQPALSRVGAAAASGGAAYAAGYRHSRELANYTRMMKLMDNPALEAPAPQGEEAILGQRPPRQPQFFSENVASVGRVFGGVKSVSITVHERGNSLAQSVVYRLQ